MKKNVLIFCCLLVLCPFRPEAQNEIFGAKAAALGSVSIAEDGWSLFNNSAQMLFQPTQCLLQCRESYGLISTIDAAVGFIYSFSENAIGVGFSQNLLGDFRQRSLITAFAHKVGDSFSMSLLCRYLLLSYSDAYYGVANGFSFSLSLCYRPDGIWNWSLVWNNPLCFHYRFSKSAPVIPSSLRLGARYTWTPSLRMYAECCKSPYFPLNCALGLEKELGFYTLRCAALFPEFQLAVGLGSAKKRFSWDLACQYHLDLGASFDFSVQFSFGEKHLQVEL